MWDRLTNTVIIVHTCGSGKISMPILNFVMNNFALYFFQFKIGFVIFGRFLRLRFS